MNKIFRVLVLLLVATQVQAQYKSLLWKITDNGLKEPSYLYGTMHTADKRIVGLSDFSQPYFNDATAYAMELDPSEAMDMGLISKIMMGKDYSLQKMLPAKEYSYLDSVVSAKVGFSMALFDNVAPVFVLTIFQGMNMGLSEGSADDKTQVLDVYFYNKAKEAKKKIIGIETVDEQLNALSALSYQEQADMLTEEIKSAEINKPEEVDIVDYYLKQDLDSLSTNDGDMKKSEKFYKALVTDRNERMSDRIAKFIKQQPTFIAIGALHLPGEKGVIGLLRKKGFKVEPVYKK